MMIYSLIRIIINNNMLKSLSTKNRPCFAHGRFGNYWVLKTDRGDL